MTLTCYAFITIEIVGLLASIVVVSAINPIHRTALLIIVFMAGAFMYTQLDFYFLGLTYIIVYVGAIAILFLFVIMMVNASEVIYDKSGSIEINNTKPSQFNIIYFYRSKLTKQQSTIRAPIYQSSGTGEAIKSGIRAPMEHWFIIGTGTMLIFILITNGFIHNYIISANTAQGIYFHTLGDNFTGWVPIGISALITPFNDICTYFFPSWAIDYYHPTDIVTLGFVIYVVYPQALIIIGIAQWVVMIGIIASMNLL